MRQKVPENCNCWRFFILPSIILLHNQLHSLLQLVYVHHDILQWNWSDGKTFIGSCHEWMNEWIINTERQSLLQVRPESKRSNHIYFHNICIISNFQLYKNNVIFIIYIFNIYNFKFTNTIKEAKVFIKTNLPKPFQRTEVQGQS